MQSHIPQESFQQHIPFKWTAKVFKKRALEAAPVDRKSARTDDIEISKLRIELSNDILRWKSSFSIGSGKLTLFLFVEFKLCPVFDISANIECHFSR